jgi:hypothetical protein
MEQEHIEKQSLETLIGQQPVGYTQFFEYAIPIVEEIIALHANDKVHGGLSAKSISIGIDGKILLGAPVDGKVSKEDDLLALGELFYYMLTGKPCPEDNSQLNLGDIFPIEAMLVVEKLLELHTSGQFISADELLSTLNEMKKEFNHQDSLEHTGGEKKVPVRLYLFLSLTMLVLIIIWIVISIIKK